MNPVTAAARSHSPGAIRPSTVGAFATFGTTSTGRAGPSSPRAADPSAPSATAAASHAATQTDTAKRFPPMSPSRSPVASSCE